MTEEQIKQNAEAYADSMIEIRGELEWCATRDDFIAGAHSRDEEIEHLARIATTYKVDAQDTVAECERLHDIIDQLRNPWHKTPPSTPDKEAGRTEGEKYIVSVNGEIHKATYEGYGRWTLENGKFETENKFTEVYWMPIPEYKKGE